LNADFCFAVSSGTETSTAAGSKKHLVAAAD
jgi:hypothetical protein